MHFQKPHKFGPLDIKGISGKENIQIEFRIHKILLSWEGTPHMDGQQAKGLGVDCVRFVAGVLDELRGTHTKVNHLPPDTAFHARESCIRAFRQFMIGFNGYELAETDTMQPGDVMITGPANGGPGHAIFIGCDQSLWHAASDNVVRSSIDILNLSVYQYKTTLRVSDRVLWKGV